MTDAGTISEAYRDEQKRLHKNPNYGVASLSFAPIVKSILDAGGFDTLSDYGAGKQNLWKRLKELGKGGLSYQPFDPAFPDYGAPLPADLVCCIDVLEHVEPDHLDAVLDDLARITRRVGFFTVHTGPAVKMLSDGRNAHIIQEQASWWLPRLCERFEIRHLQSIPEGFWVLVEARGSKQTIPPAALIEAASATKAALRPGGSLVSRVVRKLRS
jgi:hypothetical protein